MSEQLTTPEEADDTSDILHKLLVVDDHTVHRMVICRIARQAGFDVEEAAGFEAAQRMMSQNTYACVTLDLSLGERGGVDVLRHMADIGYANPVIVVSGSDDAILSEAFELARTLNLNVCRPFPKPVKLSELRDLMREIRKRQVVGLTPRGS